MHPRMKWDLTNNSYMLSFVMRILGRNIIQTFLEKYPDSQSSLKSWAQAVEANRFRHFHELKRTLGSADYVKPYTVFNISGNKYRLIVLIHYPLETAVVQRILTHSEYDKGKWRK